MKRSSLLPLMELVIMLLVFFVSAAICMRAFIRANEQSDADEMKIRASVCAQSAAETIKACGGDLGRASALYGGNFSDGRWKISFDEKCVPVDDGPYTLYAERNDGVSRYCGSATVAVEDKNGNILFSIPVSWQKEAGE